MAKKRFHNDYETFSEADLIAVGGSRYARHETTEILMHAYAVDDGQVEQWVPIENIGPRSGYSSPERYRKALWADIPGQLKEALEDPDYIWFAWNKPFEYQILLHVLGVEVPHARWRDPMILAMSLSFPGALDKVGTIIELPEHLRKKPGTALINTFSKARTPTKTNPKTRVMPEDSPAKWEEYKAYNINDVMAERACWLKMRKWNLPAHEWKLWCLDQKINEAGIPINMKTAANAVRVTTDIIDIRMEKMRKLTGVGNPNSGAQLLPWLQERGYPYGDLTKGHVARAVSGKANYTVTKLVEMVLRLRQEVSKSSTKKFAAIMLATDLDGVLRHCFQFAGAQRTWRWGGRRYQPQNLAKPEGYLEHIIHMIVEHVGYMDAESLDLIYEFPMDILTACVRPVVQAPEGMILLDADLNAIENRVLGWLAGCDKILNVFREGRCPYIDFATHLYKRSYADLYHEYKVLKDKSKRTVAKPGVLGCGYMLSAGQEFENELTGEVEATGLLGYAWNMGVKLTPEQSILSVDVFRETFVEVPEYWTAIDRAAKATIHKGTPHSAGAVTFDISGPFLRMGLPSGRHLHYFRAKVEPMKMPWGKIKPAITYWGVNEKKQWAKTTTHPGKLTENACQAIARDLLANGMTRADEEGIDIRMHVHDQVIAVHEKARGAEGLATLIACMEEVPSWAEGLPLGAEGFTDTIFRKD